MSLFVCISIEKTTQFEPSDHRNRNAVNHHQKSDHSGISWSSQFGLWGKFCGEMVDTDLAGHGRTDKNVFLQRISCNPMLGNPIKVGVRSHKVGGREVGLI